MPGPTLTINRTRLLLVVAMMAAIFVVSAQPGDHLTLPEFLSYDKAWHFMEYGLLAALCLFALHPVPQQARTAVCLGVIIFATLYGVSDEFHQSFVPLRTACVDDVVADSLGASVVAGVWWFRGR